MNGRRIAATVGSFVSLLLLIIALASEYWIEDGLSHSGLWQVCTSLMCLSYGMDVQGYIHATRAFLLIGMLAGISSFFILCASFYRAHDRSIVRHAVSTSVAAGICTLIAMAAFTGVYNSKYIDLGTSFGWSFGLGWASCPLFLITGGLAFIIAPSTTEG